MQNLKLKPNSETPHCFQHVLGHHSIIEFSDCNPEIINLASSLEPIILKAVELTKAQYISHSSKQFEPAGASGVVLIAESHLSYHSWPEHCFLAVDIFTCSDKMETSEAIDFIAESVMAQNTLTRVIERGY